MEDGEIQEIAFGTVHHPSLEWSEVDSKAQQVYDTEGYPILKHNSHYKTSSLSSDPSSSLRLLVMQTSILPKVQKLAVLDGFSEIHIGRDVSSPGIDTPRIRLKEMEVSKLHATIYWDKDRLQWAVVDMGSKHGTFVRVPTIGKVVPVTSEDGSLKPTTGQSTGPTLGTIDPRGIRLSAPRVASMPRYLQHLNELSIGGTTFLVHLHEGGLPCEECSPAGGEEIPLFDLRRIAKEKEALKRKRDALEVSSRPVSEGRDPKKALTMLKKSLLSQHGPLTQTPTPDYVDRSARRRALHPSAPDMPTVVPKHNISSTPSSHRSSPVPVPMPVISAPPTPVPSTNIGHQLLMKQGWQPGTALGPLDTDSSGETSALLEPIQVSQRTDRVGLGMPDHPPALTNTGLSWKEDGKLRRWANVTNETQARR